MKRLLGKTLGIYAGEWGKLLWIVSLFSGIFLIMAIFRNYVDTTFIKRYGSEAIPLMLLINGIVTIFAFGVMNRLGGRFPDYKLLDGFLALCALSIAVLYSMVQNGNRQAYPILFQLLNLQDSFFLVYLWNMACDLFTARQGKRIFPLIMAAQVMGTTIGSFLAAPIANAIGNNRLLVLSASGYLVLAATIRFSAKRMFPPFVFQKANAQILGKSTSQVLSIIRQYPIVRYLIVSGLIPIVLLHILAYQFSVIAQHSFATEPGLLRFLSVFRGSINLISFVLLFLVGRAYTRLGLPKAAMLQPINFTCIFAALLPFFNMEVAAGGQFFAILIQRTVVGPLNKIFFNIVPDDVAAWGRVFIRGSVVKAGVIIGALLMVALKPWLSARGMSWIAFGLSLYWIVETLLLKKRYKDVLRQVLLDGSVDFDRIETEMAIGQDMSPMIFHASDIGEILINRMPDAERSAKLSLEGALEMLQSEDAWTRQQAALFFQDHPDVRAIHGLMAYLEDTKDVRERAIEALAAYGEKALPFLESMLPHAPIHTQLGILEVMRSSHIGRFDMRPFLFHALTQAYNNLFAAEVLSHVEGIHGCELLKSHLYEKNEETLDAVFFALWVRHGDMRLIYRSLKTCRVSVAVELVEASIDRETARYLVPFIDELPISEKIARGRKVLPIWGSADPVFLFSCLSRSDDPITRMLAVYAAGDVSGMDAYPIARSLQDDADEGVRQAAAYALQRCMKGEARMPEIVYDMDTLRQETLFAGMSLKGYKAIASIATQKFFKRGDMLIEAGKDVPFLYVITDGEVACFENDGPDGRRPAKTVKERGIVGEIPFFSQLPATATCVVTSDFLETLVFTRHALQEMMYLHPQIAINVCRQFAMQLGRRAEAHRQDQTG